MSFDTQTYPKARKIYKCGWCGEDILKSEKHVHFVGKWEGEFQDWRMHTECHEVYQSGDPDDGFMFGEQKRGLLAGK